MPQSFSNIAADRVVNADNSRSASSLARENASLGSDIPRHPPVPVEMIRSDVEQYRHIEGGFELVVWVVARRSDWRLGRLDRERIRVLEARTERLRSLLLSSVSHDLRTPLAAIMGAASTMLDDEATVKVYRRRNNHVYLEPRNPAYETIDGDNATILGIVVSVLRSV